MLFLLGYGVNKKRKWKEIGQINLRKSFFVITDLYIIVALFILGKEKLSNRSIEDLG